MGQQRKRGGLKKGFKCDGRLHDHEEGSSRGNLNFNPQQGWNRTRLEKDEGKRCKTRWTPNAEGV